MDSNKVNEATTKKKGQLITKRSLYLSLGLLSITSAHLSLTLFFFFATGVLRLHLTIFMRPGCKKKEYKQRTHEYDLNQGRH